MAAKRLSPTSDVEPDGASASSGFEPEPPTVLGSTEAAPVSTYEKQRLSRIAENKRRMEALGLQNLASSVMGASRKARKGDAKGKRKVGEDDDDDNDSDNEDGDYALAWTAMVAMMMILASSMRRVIGILNYLGLVKERSILFNWGKRKVSKPKKKPRTKKLTNKLDYVDDDAELAKLSLDDFSKIVHRCKMIQGSESSCVVENAKSTYCSDQLWRD